MDLFENSQRFIHFLEPHLALSDFEHKQQIPQDKGKGNGFQVWHLFYKGDKQTKGYRYYIEAREFNHNINDNTISMNGDVEIKDRENQPRLILKASGVSIDLKLHRAVCNGNVSLLLYDGTKAGKPKDFRNLDKLEFDLQSRKIKVDTAK